MFEKRGAPRADWQAVKCLLAESWKRWNNVDAMRMSASLAFYSLMSMAPLLIIAVGVAGVLFGKAAAQHELLAQLTPQVGGQGAKAVEAILDAAGSAYSKYVSTILGFLVLLFSASGVFVELQDTLDRVWGIPSMGASGWWGMLKERAWSFLMVLGIGFLLLLFLASSTFLAAAGRYLQGMLPAPSWLLQIIGFGVSLVIIALLFAMIYKIVPHVAIVWRDVWLGALVTAVLFTVGKQLLSLYLGRATVSSPYGAAGSVVVLLLWLYYSAQIFFLGAVFTRLFTERHGSRCPAPGSGTKPRDIRSMPLRENG